MLIEAEATNCLSSTFVLKIDGRPAGKFEGRWMSEGIDVALVERRRLRFEKASWIGQPVPPAGPGPGQARSGGQSRWSLHEHWDLALSVGPAQMAREGWFATGYVVLRGDTEVARVDRKGMCSRGWFVEGHGLREEDLILIGLVYHTIMRRQASQHAAAGGHAAGS